MGIPRGHKFPPRLTQEQRQQVQDLWNQGKKMREIAPQFGITPAGVARILRKAGAERRPTGVASRITPEQWAEMIERYQAGEQTARILETYGASKGHFMRVLRRNGVPVRVKGGYGEAASNWRGGRRFSKEGYVVVWVSADDPLADAMRMADGGVLEHRLVMARALGRPLSPGETVHHINGDKQDNRIENLQLRQGHHGAGQAHQCGDCGSFNIRKIKIAEDS